MKLTAIASIAALAMTAACAQSPESIQPAYVTGTYDCAESRANVARLSSQQQSAVTGDFVGVLLIGLPISSMSGSDVEAELAIAKGQLANCV